MDIRNIDVSHIYVVERKRPVSPEKVADLQRSIAQQGLMQAIGVRFDGEHYQLVFGAHRLAAFQEAKTTHIPALVFPADTSDDACALAEIQENLARNDLTGAERKAFAAEVGRIIANMRANCDDDEDCESQKQGGSQWIDDLAKTSGTPTRTIRDWWKSFTTETGREMTPKQAGNDDRSAFFDWLEEAKKKAEAEKAEKARLAAEEKQRKEEEARQARLQEERKALMQYLNDTARMCGTDAITEWLYQWIEAQADDPQAVAK
jgi:ParB-like chromosome segregation protein Spo0J